MPIARWIIGSMLISMQALEPAISSAALLDPTSLRTLSVDLSSLTQALSLDVIGAQFPKPALGPRKRSELLRDSRKSQVRFTAEENRIIRNDADFFIRTFAPHLADQREDIISAARLRLATNLELVARVETFFGFIGISATGISAYILISDTNSFLHGRLTRRQFSEQLWRLTSVIGIAAMGVPLRRVFHIINQPHFGDYDPETKTVNLTQNLIQNLDVFQHIVTHEFVHFFGDSKWKLFPLDSLFADAFAGFRFFTLHGEDRLRQVYRSVREMAAHYGYESPHREIAFDLALELFAKFPSDPVVRDRELRSRISVLAAQAPWVTIPGMNEENVATYLYGTATNAITSQLVHVHGGDVSAGWRYLYRRSQGDTPKEAEDTAFRGVPLRAA